jgi:hypothetical protein
MQEFTLAAAFAPALGLFTKEIPVLILAFLLPYSIFCIILSPGSSGSFVTPMKVCSLQTNGINKQSE